jgi:hypothetical protein
MPPCAGVLEMELTGALSNPLFAAERVVREMPSGVALRQS